MSDISRIAFEGLPLYESIIANGNPVLKNTQLFLPNSIKFIYTPNENQILRNGMYYMLPCEFNFRELEILEKATLSLLSSDMPIQSTPLDVPLYIAYSFEGIRKIPPYFNTFKLRGDKLYLSNTKCLLVDPHKYNPITDVYSPGYGTYKDYTYVAKLIQNIIFMLRLYRLPLPLNVTDLIVKDNARIIRKSSVTQGPTLRKESNSFNIYLNKNIALSNFMPECKDIWYDFIASFYDVYTDINTFMDWRDLDV